MAGRFTNIDGSGPARVVIEQYSDTGFLLREGIRYVDEDAGIEVSVLPSDLPVTDLATVPWFLRWFVPAYGRHSLASLLHDHLVENGSRMTPRITRVEADDIFLTALESTGVPVLRRRLMWAAVNLQARLVRGGPDRFRMQAWILASLLGTATLLAAVVGREPLLALGAIVAPLAGALLWWPQYRIGLVAGYGAALLGGPAIAIALSYGAYAASERLVGLLRGRRGGASPVGRPDLDL